MKQKREKGAVLVREIIKWNMFGGCVSGLQLCGIYELNWRLKNEHITEIFMHAKRISRSLIASLCPTIIWQHTMFLFFFLFTPSLHFYGLNCSFVFRFHWITNAHLYSSLVPTRSILNPQYITIIHIIFSLALHHFLDYLINCVHWYGSICCKNYCKIK